MRYLVTIEAQAYIQRTVLVEASTEKEAGQSAYEVVKQADRLVPATFEVVTVKENPVPGGPAPVRGYVGRIL